MTNSKRLKRYPRWPKVLQDELGRALTAVQAEYPGEKAFDRLQLWRKRPHSMDAKLSRLDLMFELRHRYVAGGAGDYAAEEVLKAVAPEVIRRRQQDLGARPKTRSGDVKKRDAPIDYEAIGAALEAREYWSLLSGNKKAVRYEIGQKFRVSDRTMSEAARRRRSKILAKRRRQKGSLAK